MAPRQPPRPRGPPAPPAPQPVPGPNPGPTFPQPTPLPLPSGQTQRTFSEGSNSALQKIKLDVYQGDTDLTRLLTPWVAKAQIIAQINKLEDDQAKMAYLHLHLAGDALSWLNDQGIHHFTTLPALVEALIKQFGLNDTKRQQFRSELINMEQQNLSVQEITKKFETHWRMAYPESNGSDHQYKLHNYLRVLHPRIASQVGLQRPRTYEAAKDLAFNIELFLPKVPSARLNTLSADEPQTDTTYLATLLATSSQQHEAAMQDLKQQMAVFAATLQKERTNDMSDIKHTLNQYKPSNNRYQPYTALPQEDKATGSNSLPIELGPIRNHPRRYAQLICDACGQKGHTKFYRGCTNHPDHDPNRAL